VSIDVSEEHIASIFRVEEISSARNQQAGGKQKRRLTLNGLHGVISQKLIFFITTAVKTSNPTYLKYLIFIIPSKPESHLNNIHKMDSHPKETYCVPITKTNW
jgi:hypothetical protein